MTHESGRLANVSAALLVGGASSRIGRDKSRLALAGVACATRIASLLAALVQVIDPDFLASETPGFS